MVSSWAEVHFSPVQVPGSSAPQLAVGRAGWLWPSEAWPRCPSLVKAEPLFSCTGCSSAETPAEVCNDRDPWPGQRPQALLDPSPCCIYPPIVLLKGEAQPFVSTCLYPKKMSYLQT